MGKRLTPYLATCAYEARQFGFPMIRPVATQSPGDRQAAARETTEFYTRRPENGLSSRGIQAGEDELPISSKHVSILPLASLSDPDLLTLSYFAGGAAEYLLVEENIKGWKFNLPRSGLTNGFSAMRGHAARSFRAESTTCR